MKEVSFYIPVNSENLSVYFRHACILPRKNFPNINKEALEKGDQYFLVSQKKDYYEKDCLLEVILTNLEQERLVRSAIYPVSKPLPISRVKHVYFKDADRKDTISTAIELNSAFLPPIPNFILVEPDLESSPEPDVKNNDANDFSDQLKRFDHSLGGLALMRLSGEDYMNYSENYFSNLSFFSSLVEDQIKKSRRYNEQKIYFNDTFLRNKVFPYLNKELSEDDIEKVALDEKQVISKNKFSGQIEFDKLNGATYILAILYSYGTGEDGKGLRVDSLIASKFKSGIKEGYSEIIALCYGLYKGYYSFYKSYKVIGIERNVKFKLNSRLDYYTIESVYQKTFNEKLGSTFSFLDSWCPSLPQVKIKSRLKYRILDELVNSKKKPLLGSPEYLETFFQDEKSTRIIKDFVEQVIFTIAEDVQFEREEAMEEIDSLKEASEKEKITLEDVVRKQAAEIEELRREIALMKVGESSVSESVKGVDAIEKKEPGVGEEMKQLYKRNQEMINLLEQIYKSSKSKDIKERIKKIFNP
jgi:hypothetical protein